ncbi:hypothetical protein WQ54_20880 [Bacillus sp. SA1-12]|uniref:DUF4309 domain-containing protein n=1 Tax=Bacillus sp. SA1-12 TaxID=1455638 RepID=UPI000627465E|nr:DUF4309 domain-containing protein [Bacillus sp. SA1-12]KKI90414.1 hypothetical protein WQ54_20880 [Bacillus sp. SA1-12]
MKKDNLLIRGFSILTLVFLLFSGAAFATAATESSETPDLLIRKIMGLAYETQQTISSGPFSVGDSLKKVEKEWGSPEDLSTVAANYWSKNIRFLYDNSTGRKTITGIDDFDPQLKTIHLFDVKELLGEPVSEVEQEGNYYVTYSDNETYKLTFVFESAWINPNPTLSLYTLESVDK